jgi:hypothetical protein
MWGGGTVVPKAPPVKEIKNAGGTPAPSGSSVAGGIVKNSRAATRAEPKVPKAPRQIEPKQPKATIPRVGAGSTTPRRPDVSHAIAPPPAAPKNPYNALASPYRTQGEFNQGAEETAKASWEPKFNEIKQEEEGEKGLAAERESDNISIFNQYSKQAEESFNQAKAALAEIAARQNASTQAGQQTLQAALANTGVGGLAPVTNQGAFMQEASGLGNATNQTLANEQSEIIGELGKDKIAVPQVGLREDEAEDKNKDLSKLAKYEGERDKLTREEPAITEKTRQELMKDEETREANRIQEQIAEQKLGIEKEGKVEAAKEKNQLVRETGKEKNEENERVKREEAGIKEQAVQNQKLAYEEKIKLAKTKEQEAVAKLQAKRYDEGLKIMAAYLKYNEKQEYRPGSPTEAQAKAEGKILYQRNAEQLYKMLTEQGNLTAPEAFKLMQSSGNGYIEQYAREHEEVYNNDQVFRARHIPFNPKTGKALPKGVGLNKAGGEQDVRQK